MADIYNMECWETRKEVLQVIDIYEPEKSKYADS